MEVPRQRLCCLLAYDRQMISKADLAACLQELDSRDPASSPEPILLARRLVTAEQWDGLLRHSAPDAGCPSPSADQGTGRAPAVAGGPGAGLLAPGLTWGKFLIERVLGAGGQAVVYQAFDRFGAVGHVALKVPLHPIGPAQAEHWVHTEVQPLTKLDHPNIVRVADAGLVGSVPYVATRLVEGVPLPTYVKAAKPSLAQIADWTARLADALDAAHRRGIVHRDVKPLNVLVTPDGTPCLIDFGLSTLASVYPHEPDRAISGTIPFMAPEQARGDPEADHRVDVFALGGLLKFLLVGEGPYAGEPDPFLAAREGRVRLLGGREGPALFRALARIANRALAPDPAARYATAGDMAAALRRLGSRRRVAALAAVAGLAALLAVALLALGHLRREPPIPKIDASLQVYFQRKNQVGSYQTLAPATLPLRTGDRIQIHAKLSEPLATYLLAISSSGEGRLIFRPPAGKPDGVTEVRIPPGEDEWLELTPPEGTETLLLLARREPIEDADSLASQLLKLGPPPSLDGLALLELDDAGPRVLLPPRERGLGEKPVKSDKGFLHLLCQRVPRDWQVIRVLAFPHERGEAAAKDSDGGHGR